MSATAQAGPEKGAYAKLFISNGRQAARLPAGIHLEGDSVKVRRLGGSFPLEPAVLHRRRTGAEIAAMFDYIDSLGADDLFRRAANRELLKSGFPSIGLSARHQFLHPSAS